MSENPNTHRLISVHASTTYVVEDSLIFVHASTTYVVKDSTTGGYCVALEVTREEYDACPGIIISAGHATEWKSLGTPEALIYVKPFGGFPERREPKTAPVEMTPISDPRD